MQTKSRWHHAPEHRLKANGAYILTGATLHKEHLFRAPEHLDKLQSTLFELVTKYGLELRAWALFSNHYHLIMLTFPESNELSRFLHHFHSLTARDINKAQCKPGRQVWHQFWDTKLTHRTSYYARLRYVMENPVKHGMVTEAKHYPWCSVRWFAENSEQGHYNTVMSFKTDKVTIYDDF